MFVLKNADCLGQDLDPAGDYHYVQKDMPNVRRIVLLELIRLKIISGTAAATLSPSIDPKLCDKGSGESKGDGDQTKGGITALENRDSESDNDSEPFSKRRKLMIKEQNVIKQQKKI